MCSVCALGPAAVRFGRLKKKVENPPTVKFALGAQTKNSRFLENGMVWDSRTSGAGKGGVKVQETAKTLEKKCCCAHFAVLIAANPQLRNFFRVTLRSDQGVKMSEIPSFFEFGTFILKNSKTASSGTEKPIFGSLISIFFQFFGSGWLNFQDFQNESSELEKGRYFRHFDTLVTHVANLKKVYGQIYDFFWKSGFILKIR